MGEMGTGKMVQEAETSGTGAGRWQPCLCLDWLLQQGRRCIEGSTDKDLGSPLPAPVAARTHTMGLTDGPVG